MFPALRTTMFSHTHTPRKGSANVFPSALYSTYDCISTPTGTFAHKRSLSKQVVETPSGASARTGNYSARQLSLMLGATVKGVSPQHGHCPSVRGATVLCWFYALGKLREGLDGSHSSTFLLCGREQAKPLCPRRPHSGCFATKLATRFPLGMEEELELSCKPSLLQLQWSILFT